MSLVFFCGFITIGLKPLGYAKLLQRFGRCFEYIIPPYIRVKRPYSRVRKASFYNVRKRVSSTGLSPYLPQLTVYADMYLLQLVFS
jgi:hypothetical protein